MLELIIIVALILAVLFFKYRKKIIIKSAYIPKPTTLNGAENELLLIINAHRVANGLSELIPEETLVVLCEAHCLYMITENKPSHDYYMDRVKQSQAKELSENACYNYLSPAGIFHAYQVSDKGHYENMMSPTKTHIGIATIQDYNTILFAKY